MNRMFSIYIRRLTMATVASGLLITAAQAQIKSLKIPALPVPSLGFFTSAVIKDQGFDKKNGLDITFVQKPASTYRTDFAAGTDLIGGSGTLLADVALLNQKGVETVYLFNIFDFWATVVTAKDSDINRLSDLKGKTLAASLPTTSYAMFQYFASLDGLDLKTIKPVGTTVPGLMPTALAGRTDAVQLWEPAYSQLMHDSGDHFRTIDFVGDWKKKTGTKTIPYLGIAVHKTWIEQNKDAIEPLYNTFKDAEKFINENPEESVRLIAEATKIDEGVLRDLIASDRLGLHVYWASDHEEAIKEVFKAGVQTGYLSEMPGPSVIYHPED